ncbi:MAG: ABC transporter substrate-binding protein, partial [Dehalococcoidia bacterium]|nr:ABC transporter substrate-binding protein [Dehalococcoidia bacterium]
MPTPSATNLVWPVHQGGITVSWDPDSSRLGQGARRSAPYHTVHLPYEPLTTPYIATDADGVRYPVAENLQPRLAVSWEASPDYRVWTMRLRRGVTSHYGNPLTAEGVRWCWERVYHLQRVGYWRSKHLAGLESIDDLTAIDDDVLQFRLSGPNPEFPQYTSFATNNVFDAIEARKHATEDDPWAATWLESHIAGFGAFTLDRQDARTLHFVARDDYWAGRPGVDTVTQIGVDTREEAFRLVERGEANMLIGLYPEELARFAGRPDYQIIRVRANHSTLEFNWLEPPFDDQNVRHAICYALPYERIIEQVY